ncbi:UNVERIFIED_CONTAM: hypothetical protein HDU68_008627 [Siphonaria sp. JEL0065]|nr:hypothetical protein HDU68_008627 [Siphonaria sp. JEL0065]
MSMVELHTFPETGRGLRAKQDLALDSIVLSAEWSTVWTVEAAHQEPVLGEILVANQLSVDDTLALYLLFVKLSPKCSKSHSRKAHIKTGIPESYTASAFFEDDELQVAQGSTLYNLTTQSLNQIEDDFRSLLHRIVLRHPDVFPLGKFNLEEYKWALFTIWSRAMDFKVSEEKSLRGIVPFLDMVNHSFDVKQCHVYDPSSNTVKILAGKNYKEGEEVFINYGPVGNTKLLRLYGFVIPGNQFNAFDLVLSTSPLAPFFKEKSDILAAAQVPLDAAFQLTLQTPLPTPVLQYLRIQRLEWTELNLVTAIADKTKAGVTPFTARNEYEILTTLEESFDSILAGFPVKADQLEAWIELGKFKKYSNSWMSAIVSLEEQQILAKSLAEVRRLLAGLVCGQCGKGELGLKKCSRCNVTGYCGAVCQKQHWGVHKLGCVNQ